MNFGNALIVVKVVIELIAICLTSIITKGKRHACIRYEYSR